MLGSIAPSWIGEDGTLRGFAFYPQRKTSPLETSCISHRIDQLSLARFERHFAPSRPAQRAPRKGPKWQYVSAWDVHPAYEFTLG